MPAPVPSRDYVCNHGPFRRRDFEREREMGLRPILATSSGVRIFVVGLFAADSLLIRAISSTFMVDGLTEATGAAGLGGIGSTNSLSLFTGRIG